MKRSIEVLGGLLVGFVVGTMCLAEPIAAAVNTYLKATWSLDGCPAGVYVLSSTAQLGNGGPVFTVNTPVRVPQSDVVQTFNDVPPGQYTVSAALRRSNGGAIVASASQTLTTVNLSALARSSAPAESIKGRATPRRPSTPPASSSASSVFRKAVTVAPAAAAPSPPSAESTPRAVGVAVPREWALLEIARQIQPRASESGWYRMVLTDEDGDGLADEIRIEAPDTPAIVVRIREM